MASSIKVGTRFKAVVFDLDGTLLVQNVDFSGLRCKLGVPENESLLDWIDSRPSEQRIWMTELMEEIELEAARKARLLPGARATLEWLRSTGVPFGVLTRNSLRSWFIVSSICGLDFIGIVRSRDTKPVKPAPGSVLPMLAGWEVRPEEAVHVGDYLYDLQLARSTGMYSILLSPDGENRFPVSCDFVSPGHFTLVDHLKEIL